MVHPHVLEMCGIDPEEYNGFAFGVGLERIALLKYEIDDMRLLYENDIRFLKQLYSPSAIADTDCEARCKHKVLRRLLNREGIQDVPKE